MTAQLIDGKATAQALREKVTAEVVRFTCEYDPHPGGLPADAQGAFRRTTVRTKRAGDRAQ